MLGMGTIMAGASGASGPNPDGAFNSSTTSAVPVMTSNTSPSGVVSASSTYSGTYAAWRAFDGIGNSDPSTWVCAVGAFPAYLRYQFPSAIVVNKYMLKPQIDNPSTNPASWTLRGSNDGLSWTTLDTRSVVTGWANDTFKIFTFSNGAAFAYYEINISSSAGGTTGAAVAIAELALVEWS